MRFLRKIKQVIEWAPIIWKDEDWDYGYLLRLLDYKLSRMVPVIRNGFACDAEKTALQIERARQLLACIGDDSGCETEHWHKLWKYLDKNMRSWWD